MLKRIKKNLLQARKAKDKFQAGILGALVSEGAMIGKNDGNRETTDQEMLKLIQKFKKGVTDTIELIGCDKNEITKNEDPSKCLELFMEVNIYDEYLPKQMDEEEIVKAIGHFIGQSEKNANIGSIMKYFRENFNGQFDGKELSKIAKNILGG
jgi:uncharacterized protein YqeY